MNQPLALLDLIVRLTAAAIAGGILGWEREVHEKTAGLRTHMMVSLGAATIVVIGHQMIASIDVNDRKFQLDPQRLLEAVVGGVGFLGAGAIIQSRGSVKGLTTAASVWLSAAVGIACGTGFYAIAAISTVLGLVILFLLQFLQPAAVHEKVKAACTSEEETKAESGELKAES